MKPKQASCISCHAVSSIESNGTDGINILAALSTPPVGEPAPLPSSAWIRRDFVWSLGEACPNGPGMIGSLNPNCTSGPDRTRTELGRQCLLPLRGYCSTP